MKSQVFTNHPNSGELATIGWQNKLSALWGIQEGYKNAADKLVASAIRASKKNNVRVLDTYIFPVMFLYRHSVEINLKLICLRFEGTLPKGNHDLLVLWDHVFNEIVDRTKSEEFRTVVKTYKKNFKIWSTDGIELNKLRNFIVDVQKIDRESDVWRYLLDKDGSLYFEKTRIIEYPEIRKNFHEILNILDYIYDAVDDYLSGDPT